MNIEMILSLLAGLAIAYWAVGHFLVTGSIA